MAKFHINKHGVPAPCKARKGNCPLGGEESHFPSQEAAQEYVNKINASEHGLLPGAKEEMYIEAPKELINRLFIDAYDPGDGYIIAGVSSENVFIDSQDVYPDMADSDDEVDRQYACLEDFIQYLPDELVDDYLGDGPNKAHPEDRFWNIIPQKNVKAHIRRYLLQPREFDIDETYYEDVVATVKQYAPSEVNEDEYYMISKDIEEKIAEFAANKIIEDSTFYINDEKFYLERTPDFNKNWAKEYFESLSK